MKRLQMKRVPDEELRDEPGHIRPSIARTTAGQGPAIRNMAGVGCHRPWDLPSLSSIRILACTIAGFLSGTRIISVGILLFILLPVFRVFLMLLVFLKERDYRFSVIAGLVLMILILGFIVGMRVSAGAG